MVKLTPIFLILFFSNILSLKIFYIKHFLKQNPDVVNSSFFIRNTKPGMLVTYCIEQKIKIEFFMGI
jgi:hypothetical protein